MRSQKISQLSLLQIEDVPELLDLLLAVIEFNTLPYLFKIKNIILEII